jgi:hypothetical protein
MVTEFLDFLLSHSILKDHVLPETESVSPCLFLNNQFLYLLMIIETRVCSPKYITLNSTTVNELESMWMEEVVACFETLYRRVYLKLQK